MFQVLKESYINLSDHFYGPDYINYTNVKDGIVSLDEKTRFLSEETKAKLNKDPLEFYSDAVYIVEYQDIYYLILDYVPHLDKGNQVKIHELVIPDTIQGMTSNLHHYNTEAEPILLTYQGDFSLAAYVQKNVPDNVFRNEFSTVYIYQGSKAELLLKELSDINNFYLADGHHRLFVTELVEEKKSVLTAVTSIEDLTIHSIGRVIPDITDDKMQKALDFLEKRQMLVQVQDLDKGYVRIKWNNENYYVKLVDLDGDSFWNNDVYRFNTQVLSQAFGIYKSELVKPLYKCEEVNYKENYVYVYFHPMSSEEFIEVVSKNSILPPKSTYFEPKFPSNFILKKFK